LPFRLRVGLIDFAISIFLGLRLEGGAALWGVVVFQESKLFVFLGLH